MSDFKNKYHLSLQENLFIAKKCLVQNIYSGAKVEGLNVTYPETQAIVDGVNVAKLTIDDILVIHNLKSAWKFILNNIEKETDLQFIMDINGEVSRNESLDWGHLRTGNVGIGGTDYIPPIPKKEQVIQALQSILSFEISDTEKALELYLYCCRNQLFWDGNKRTAFIVANKFLIEKGCGLLTIKDCDIVEYNDKLNSFYNDENNKKEIKRFLYEKCIHCNNFQ